MCHIGILMDIPENFIAHCISQGYDGSLCYEVQDDNYKVVPKILLSNLLRA